MWFLAAGIVADSPQCGMLCKTFGKRATNGSSFCQISFAALRTRTWNGKPVAAQEEMIE